MERRDWRASLTFIVLMLACRFTPSPTATLPPPTPSLLPATRPPTAVGVLALPSITPSPTTTFALASPKDQRLNCRYGPGTVYAVIGTLEEGKTTQIAGINAEQTWWYIHDPGNPGGFCWVLAELTDTEGNLTGIPVIAQPAVTVTKIDMTVTPPHRSVRCDAFPQSFYITAEITVNGPVIVRWRWEVSTGETSPETLLTFTESGSQLIEYYYLTPAANDYAVRMHVVGPNDTLEQVNFRIDCTLE